MFLNGIFEGFYLTVMLSMGIEFFFDPFHLKQGKISPAMQLFGLAMLSEFLCSLTGVAFNSVFPGFPFMWHVSHFFDVCAGCFLCLTGFSILQGKYPSWKLIISIFLPTMAVTIPTFFGLYKWNLAIALVFAFESYALGYQIRMFYRHDNRLKDFYSNTEKYEILWVSWYFVFFLFNTTLYFITFLNFSWGNVGAILYSLILIGFYSYMGVRLLKLDVATSMLAMRESNDGDSEESEDTEDSQHILTEEQEKQFDAELTRLMEDEKLYHNKELCTDDLMKALHTNSSYLYYFMRDVKHTRFYDYINGYRIEEAKQLLVNTNEKIETIALECGFNSYNTFVSAFKKTVGDSPSRWRKTSSAS